MRDEGVQLTTFVQPRPNGAIDVWYLPAFQPDGWAVYGIELRYTLDRSARTVTDSSMVVGTLRGSLLDSTVTIEIDNERNPTPTVGLAFFAMLYASRFDAILIYDRDFISEFAMTDGQRAWVHDRKEVRLRLGRRSPRSMTADRYTTRAIRQLNRAPLP